MFGLENFSSIISVLYNTDSDLNVVVNRLGLHARLLSSNAGKRTHFWDVRSPSYTTTILDHSWWPLVEREYNEPITDNPIFHGVLGMPCTIIYALHSLIYRYYSADLLCLVFYIYPPMPFSNIDISLPHLDSVLYAIQIVVLDFLQECTSLYTW